jgi:hypothetical protein
MFRGAAGSLENERRLLLVDMCRPVYSRRVTRVGNVADNYGTVALLCSSSALERLNDRWHSRGQANAEPEKLASRLLQDQMFTFIRETPAGSGLYYRRPDRFGQLGMNIIQVMKRYIGESLDAGGTPQ